VSFAKLRLVVTDEQHRFGVRQRALLREKADIPPHMLVMSATPIPRSLAMVLYGDMDVSVIDELPPGRIPIDTRAPDEDKRGAVYGFLRRQLSRGRQGYVVCPVIEETETEDMTAAKVLADELRRGELAGYRVELLHGRMSAREKDEIMTAFAGGEINVLVATTVIEVGVNVPNANMMIIENAERFGLSQLHQLRGRVGRSDIKSYCVLMSKFRGETVRQRLDVMCRTNDGFEIAREDLRLRGPGEFFGSRQSGVPGLKMAALGADMLMLSQARSAAEEILRRDPTLTLPESAELSAQVNKLFDVERS
jgi:ATP-dependent DNA helicase RecG